MENLNDLLSKLSLVEDQYLLITQKATHFEQIQELNQEVGEIKNLEKDVCIDNLIKIH